MSLKLCSSAVYTHQNVQLNCRNHSYKLSFKPNRLCQNAPKVSCSMDMTAGPSDDSKKLSVGYIIGKARSLWDSSPEPVKSFPWNRTFENFVQLILDLVLIVTKYLSLPVFVITSLSEMSYCAHERKLYLVPFPFLIGSVVAGVLKTAALESSPLLKNAEVPWHLIAILALFALIKFPGPYYPYWGRIFIPHLANGALVRTLWFMFLWYRKSRITSKDNIHDARTDVRE